MLHGLKLVAVAIVAQAVWGMARTLCPDRQRASIACVAVLMILSSTSSVAQLGTILMGGITGFWLCRAGAQNATASFGMPVSRRAGFMALTLFFSLLVALPVLGRFSQGAQLFDAFYRSGALVFGGGHVVLPLLSKAFVTPGWVSQDSFLAGYGAAQAVPGPLFTFAAYLGAVVTTSPHGIAGAAVGLIGFGTCFASASGRKPSCGESMRLSWGCSERPCTIRCGQARLSRPAISRSHSLGLYCLSRGAHHRSLWLSWVRWAVSHYR